VLYSQLMAKLKSENAVSDDLETSKVDLETSKYFGMCAPDTKYFNVLPPPKSNSIFF
jgi:hypothetical protein